MTSTEIAQRPAQTELTPQERALREQVRMIQDTEFVPKNYRGKPHEIYACILTGKALGIDPMHALRSIHMVDGKATLSAELMVALARRAGHSISGKSSADEAVATGKRGDNGDEFTVTFTIGEAKAAGLLTEKRPSWAKYPADMLWARAVSRLCRRLFPDVLAGVSYTPDEAQLSPEERNAAATEELPLPPDEEALSEPDVIDGSSAVPPAAAAEDGPDRKQGRPSGSESAVVEEQDGALALKLPPDVRANMRKERGE